MGEPGRPSVLNRLSWLNDAAQEDPDPNRLVAQAESGALALLGLAAGCALMTFCKQILRKKSLMSMAGVLQAVAGRFSLPTSRPNTLYIPFNYHRFNIYLPPSSSFNFRFHHPIYQINITGIFMLLAVILYPFTHDPSSYLPFHPSSHPHRHLHGTCSGVVSGWMDGQQTDERCLLPGAACSTLNAKSLQYR